MAAIQSKLCRSGMLAIALSALLVSGPARAYTPEQQQACSGDAFRVCGSEIPNIERITACMIRNKAALSPGCRAFFRPHERVAAPAVRAHRPVRVAPVIARKPVEARAKRAKKPRRAAGAT
jgi:hypothetical protein